MGGGGLVRDICQAKWYVAWGGRPRLDRKMVAYVEVKNRKQTKKTLHVKAISQVPASPASVGKCLLSGPPLGP